MKTYDSYKNSRNEWVGEIPAHWEIDRLKNIFSFRTGLSITKKDLLDVGIPCVNYGEIHSKYGFEVNPKIHSLKCVDEKYLITSKKSLLKKGDFIFADTSEDIEGSGNFTYLNSDVRVFAGYHTIVAKPKSNLNYRFVAYLFDSIYYRNQFRGNVVGIKVYSITQGLLNRFKIFFPPKREQTAIANYLDIKTTAIDKKISLLEIKITRYKELSRSLINETVRKGLNRNVPLKDAVIEWIGEIPKHWQVKRLKELGRIETSSVNKKIEENEQKVKLVNYTDIYGNTTKEIRNSDDYMIVSAKKEQIRRKKLKKGDVLLTPSSETIEDIGVSAVVMENLKNTLYSYHIFRLRFYRKINDSFKKYMLNNDFVQYYFSKSSKGTTRKILSLNDFYSLQVIIPPIEEQVAIAEYLDKKTKTIDAIVANIKAQIDSLKELRKTLINDVVTGKLKVTE